MHSFVDPSQRYIVFVSDRDTPGSNQLYLGKVIVDHQLNPSFPPKFYRMFFLKGECQVFTILTLIFLGFAAKLLQFNVKFVNQIKKNEFQTF